VLNHPKEDVALKYANGDKKKKTFFQNITTKYLLQLQSTLKNNKCNYSNFGEKIQNKTDFKCITTTYYRHALQLKIFLYPYQHLQPIYNRHYQFKCDGQIL
jgi:hypothetical protein